MKSMKYAVSSHTMITLLLVSTTLTGFGCRPKEKVERVQPKDLSPDQRAIIEYYTTQGTMTDPGKYVHLYQQLPSEPAELCRVLHGILIHVFHAHRHGIELSEERKQEVHIRKVEDMLGRIMKLDGSPVISPREPNRRLVANCRDFSVFICSLLRHKEIPARARCGFGTYFTPGRYEDHWIAEYWSSTEQRWVQIDAQLDSLQKEALQIEFNQLDMPPGKFLPAGEVWKSCRIGEIDPELCGIFDLRGLWFVKDNLVRDFMALNKLELLPWDCNEFMELSEEPNAEQYVLFDRIAELTTAGDESFSEMRSLYESNSELRMPEDWTP